jgi:hypothetical protein
MTNPEDKPENKPEGEGQAPESGAPSQPPAEPLDLTQPSAPKKKRARKKKAPAPRKPDNVFQAGLEDITSALAAEQKQVDRAISNYENHLKALDVVREYLNSGIKKYRKGDTPVAGADNFTDGTSYVPILRKIAGLNRDIDDISKKYDACRQGREKDRKAAQKKLAAVREELEKVKKEYEAQKEKYESELEQARKKSKMYDFVKKRRDELIRKHPFTEVKTASQSEDAMNTARPTTYYEGQPTVATDCLEDAVKYQRTVDAVVEGINQTTQRIREIMEGFGKPPAE